MSGSSEHPPAGDALALSEQNAHEHIVCKRGDGRPRNIAATLWGSPPWGADGSGQRERSAKGVPRRAAPGPVGPRASPKARPRERQRAFITGRAGMGVPPWGFLILRGRLGRGGPGGETQAGEARHALRRSRWPRGRAGGSINKSRAIRMSRLRGREGSVQALLVRGGSSFSETSHQHAEGTTIAVKDPLHERAIGVHSASQQNSGRSNALDRTSGSSPRAQPAVREDCPTAAMPSPLSAVV